MFLCSCDEPRLPAQNTADDPLPNIASRRLAPPARSRRRRRRRRRRRPAQDRDTDAFADAVAQRWDARAETPFATASSGLRLDRTATGTVAPPGVVVPVPVPVPVPEGHETPSATVYPPGSVVWWQADGGPVQRRAGPARSARTARPEAQVVGFRPGHIGHGQGHGHGHGSPRSLPRGRPSAQYSRPKPASVRRSLATPLRLSFGDR